MSELTQIQREQMQKDLLSMQADINSKLSALGISRKANKDRRAPDGGPTSDAHTFMIPKINNTFRVVRKNPDGSESECLVNDSIFDSATMTKVEDLAKKPRVVSQPSAPKTVSKKVIKVSSLSREDMLVMTMARLEKLPEVEHIEDIPKDKTDLIEAILDVREESIKK
jgi:hypothetical protein